MLNHTGGTYSHNCMMDYPRFPSPELHLGNFLTLWNFKAGKSTSRLKFVQEQQILRSLCIGSKKLRWQSELTNFMTSRSIVGRDDFPDFDMLDAMIASALKKLLNTHVHFRKRVSVEEQRARKHERFLR